MRSITKRIILIILLFFISLSIACKDNKIVNIEVELKTPSFVTYYVGDDVPDILCWVFYEDGSKEIVADYNTSITKFSNSGQVEVEITYKGFSDAIIFNVKDRSDQYLEVRLKDGANGDRLSINDYEVVLISKDGKIKIIKDYNVGIAKALDDNYFEVIFEYDGIELDATIKLAKESLLSLNVPKSGLCNLVISDAKAVISNVHYGGDRKANYIVYYDETNRIKTNQFGFEFLINEDGIIVDADTIVEIKKGYSIISAHGEGKNTITKAMSNGDYVYYDKASANLYVFSKFNTNIDSIKTYDRIYNIANMLCEEVSSENLDLPLIIKDINDLINKANELINSKTSDISIDVINNLEEEVMELIIQNKLITNANHKLIYLSEDVLAFKEIDDVKFYFINPLNVATIIVNHSGGYRATNEVVHYDKSNLVNRNEFGYEIAVNRDGMIVDLGINVDLPEDGFIISGHGSGKDAIIANCRLNDKVEYIDGKINVYRDPYTSKVALYKAQIEELMNYVNDAYENCIPLYYGSLHSIINKAIEELNQINGIVFQNPDSLKSLISFNDSKVEEYIYEASVLTLDQNAIGNKCFWYDTAKLAGLGFSDDSVDAVDKLLAFVKDEGFNTIYLSVESHGYVLYKSSFLKPMADFYVKDGQYGEYKDYLDCITSLAKEYGISIRIWLKAMVAGDASDIPNNIPTNYLCTDISGNLPASGHIHFDATNPEVREFIKDIYLEIVNNYDVDGVELDYIRYESSNLANLKGQITASQINDYSFSEYAINHFMEVNNLSGDFTTLFLNDASIRQKWIEYKKDSITEVVKLVSSEVKKVNSNVSVTASVFRYRSKDNVCQDWPKWLEEGYLDFIEPMIYSNDDEYFEKDVVDAYNHLASKYMIVGVGPMVSSGDTYQLIRQIRFLEKYGCGYSVFSAAQMFNDENFVNAFAKYNKYTLSLKAPKIDKAKALACLLLNEINGYYKKVNNYDYSSIINILNMINNDYKEGLINSLIEEVDKIDNELIKNNMLAKINQINVG